jgi:phospholipid/cholesterol/gamma-HCH transport system substrate-binding protein
MGRTLQTLAKKKCMKKETKVGLLTIVSLFVLIWGYKFLKGQNILARSQVFYIEYSDVDGLLNSNPVMVHGFQVGTVRAMYLNPNNLERVIVELDVRKDIQVPKNTVAKIVASSVMGGKMVVLDIKGHCAGPDCAQSGDSLPGTTSGLLGSMLPAEELEAYISILTQGISVLTDTLKQKMEGSPDSELSKSLRDLQNTLASLSSISSRIDQLLASNAQKLNITFSNLQSLSASLTEGGKIDTILQQLSILTTQLNENDIVGELGSLGSSVKTSLEGVNTTFTQLNGVIEGLERGEGSLGKLLKDEKMAADLQRTLDNINFLTQDLRLNPKRYTRVLSKKQIPYEKPEDDPAFEGKE